MELVPGIEVVNDIPAVYIRKFDTLVIADLHLGFEEDMASKGVFLPRVQLKKILKYIETLVEATTASRIVIAGDVKHIFEKLGKYEMRELIQLFDFLKKKFEKVVLVRGNHDTFVYGLAKKYGIEFVDSLWLGTILIVHGHRPLDAAINPSVVIMGHEHPSIALRDSLGSLTKLPCFLVAPTKRGSILIVLPAMGVYQSGTAVTTNRESYLSPIIREEAILEEAVPYAIVEGDGVYELPKLKLLESIPPATSL